MDIQTDGIKRKRFLWGVGLAWTPFLFLIIPLFSAFNGIAREKATGLAVVGGGLVKFFYTFGLARRPGIRSGCNHHTAAHILRRPPGACALLGDLHLL